MRTTGLILIFIIFISLKAQTQMHFPVTSYSQQGAFAQTHFLNDSNTLKKKWSVSMYGGLAAGIGFFNAGNATFFPAQIGLQLNRRLNNNLYAFAGVAATPGYFNFNRSIPNADPYKNYMTSPGFGANGFGIYHRAELGLMYINDDKTFSISGSIGVSNSRYPFYSPNKTLPQKQPFATTRQ